MSQKLIRTLEQHASHMRETALKIAFECGDNAHLGGGLSIIDVLSVLYGKIMNASNMSLPYEKRDKFILSKGHGVLGLYTALYEFGIIDEEKLSTFMKNGSDLIAHPVMKPEIGLESSSGSLGQGISMAVGLALAAKKKGYTYNTYVVCGNGECNEGSVWEACMSAVSFGLDNFTVYIDNNHMQSDGDSDGVLNVSDKYTSMLKALGFQTIEVDGNNVEELVEAFEVPNEKGVPKAIVGNTVKGKGISFMENNNTWHHNRLTREQYELAIEELSNN